MAPEASIEMIPSGVDTEWFDPHVLESSPEPLRLVTTGDYGWPPTADGLKYLVNDIYPKIRQEIPDAKLSIVGNHPPESVTGMSNGNGIEVLGRVEDVRPEILRSSVFVVPTRIGSGIRLKILEAMALRRPVVSTSVGCEGIEAIPEKDILVADDPDTFAASVVRLLRDQTGATDMVDSAEALIHRRYAWSTLATEFDRLYRSLVD
jgi:glycosyltransferase involved in cell wall biosynthesis